MYALGREQGGETSGALYRRPINKYLAACVYTARSFDGTNISNDKRTPL